MNDLTIIHLSDLHIDENGRTYSLLLKALLKDLKTQVDKLPSKYLVLVITGDLINKGNCKAINNAKLFFKDLKDQIGSRLISLYVVPGNHDKCRTEANKLLIPAYRSYYDSKCSYATKDRIDIKGFDDKFYSMLWDMQRTTYEESKYNELMSYIYTDLFPQFHDAGAVSKNTFGVHVLQTDSKKYCFVLLNTAWSCIDDQDNRHIVIGDFQLKKIKEDYDQQTDGDEIALTLAMGHHPLNCLYGSEQDSVFEQLIFQEGIPSEVYMCGHTHDRDIINWSNTDHTMYTLMTGIGWPDTTSSGTQYHYYSIYNFNIEINSFEIIVRSRTKGKPFCTDLSIYGGDKTTQLVRAIRPDEQQAVISINSADGSGQKKIFLTSQILEMTIGLSQAFGKVSTIVQKIIWDDVLELDNYRVLATETIEADNAFRLALFERYDGLVLDSDYDISEDAFFVDTLKIHDNKDLITENFNSFLQKLCQSLKEEILMGQDGSSLSFEFRSLADRDSYTYSTLCRPFSQEEDDFDSEDETRVPNEIYGQLVKKAFRFPSSKSIVYSANTEDCSQQLEESGKLKNIIIIIPDFPENVYKDSENKNKKTPYITFDVAIDDDQYAYWLYLFEYYKMDKVLGDHLRKYIRCFKINLDEFCVQCRRG